MRVDSIGEHVRLVESPLIQRLQGLPSFQAVLAHVQSAPEVPQTRPPAGVGTATAATAASRAAQQNSRQPLQDPPKPVGFARGLLQRIGTVLRGLWAGIMAFLRRGGTGEQAKPQARPEVEMPVETRL
jgi:hypothetical protein